ncbi:MAG TPA: EamA family transporter [Nitriliruptorales bacterium]
MSPSNALILFGAVSFATSGQLLLKSGMNTVGTISRADGLWHTALQILTTWQVLLGFALFGLSSMFWLAALSRLPLSTAYPVVSLSYVLILFFSVTLLGERPSLTVWTGALFVMTGVALIGIGQR